MPRGPIDSFSIDCCRLYFYDTYSNLLRSFDLETATLRTFDGGAIELRDDEGNKRCLSLQDQVVAGFNVSDILTAISDCCVATASNSPPTNAGTFPSSVAYAVGSQSPLDFSGLDLADADSDPLTLTLVAISGLLFATSGGGVTVTGSGTNTLTLAGSIADLNTFLDNVDNITYSNAAVTTMELSVDSVTGSVSDGTDVTPLGSAAVDSTNFLSTDVQKFLFPTQSPIVTRVGSQSYLVDGSTTGDRRTPRLGRKYLLNGSNEYASKATRVTSGAISAMAFSAWVKTTDTQGGFATEYDSPTNNKMWFAGTATTAGYAVTDKFSVWISADGGATNMKAYSSATTITDGAWHHVAFVFDSGTLKLFVDGVEETPTKNKDVSVPTIYNATTNLVLGSTFFNLAGSLADVRIWQGTIPDASHIALLANWRTCFDPSIPTPIAGYWLSEESGSTAYDWTGNGHHLTITGNTSTIHTSDTGVKYNHANEVGYRASGAVIIPRKESAPATAADGSALTYAGRVPYDATLGGLPCVTFNGTSEYAKVTGVSLTGDWTYSLWVNSALASSTLNYCAGLSIGVQKGITTGAISGSKWGLYDAVTTLAASSSVSQGVWTHLAVTKSGTTYSFFKDGVADGSGTLTDIDINLISLGRRDDGNQYFSGSIADARVFDSALTQPDIALIYAGGTPAAAPIAHYPCTARSGATLNDVSGNGHHLTITSSNLPVVWGTTNNVNDYLVRTNGYIPADGTFVNRFPANYPKLLLVQDDYGNLHTAEAPLSSRTIPNYAIDDLDPLTTVEGDPITTVEGDPIYVGTGRSSLRTPSN